MLNEALPVRHITAYMAAAAEVHQG